MQAIRTPGLSELAFVDDEEEVGLAEFRRQLDARRAVPRGAFEVVTQANGQRYLWFKCLGPCGKITPLPLRPVIAASGDSWEWDGNEDAPTLSPSINHTGCWHGWLRAGVFVVA